ncbi:DUF1702 family protein [Actinomadura sp. DSM 109109]|nr:DUF1702 family protein [Actinomadura lepetitiana]
MAAVGNLIAPPLRGFLEIDPKTLDVDRLGFPPGDPQARARLADVVQSFATGFNTALGTDPAALEFTELPHDLRGFAFEGAAMGVALVDLATFSGGRRVRALAEGTGARYVHLIHVGVGWAYARTHLHPWTGIRYGRPLLRWLAWDGWGFHQAFFKSERVLVRHWIERPARGNTRTIRDQGIGRALWFYAGGDPVEVAGTIGAFPAARRPDVWAGIGLAAAYTGALPPDRLAELLELAAGFEEHVAQGAAFAAKAHVVSLEVPGPSAKAIETLTGAAPEVAAAWTDEAALTAEGCGDGPEGYEVWRARVRQAWRKHSEG